MSPEVFRILTVERGWSEDEYEAWLAPTLRTQLLRPVTAMESGPATSSRGVVPQTNVRAKRRRRGVWTALNTLDLPVLRQPACNWSVTSLPTGPLSLHPGDLLMRGFVAGPDQDGVDVGHGSDSARAPGVSLGCCLRRSRWVRSFVGIPTHRAF